ncbi:MAG: phosphoenolpyruvate--protein phosphotransferase [Caulobacterales bacterium]
MPAGGIGSRHLLRQLRDLMAEGGAAQERLDRMVRMIAATMVADVCSIYVLRQDGALELFATEGLKKESVHQTRLKPGEGLVGLVVETAEPLNLPDAPKHPKFAYRPETGEDPYNSFLGVPILRGGRPLGVLVVQNAVARRYDEDEEEALQTIAMVVAEIISAGGLAVREYNGAADGAVRVARSQTLKGRAWSDGVSIGTIVFAEPSIQVSQMLADDPGKEEQRLDEALHALKEWIDDILSGDGAGLIGASREVIEAYQLLAHDPNWYARLRDSVRQGLTADAAVVGARSEHRARMSAARDPYLRERLHDMEDLDNRLLRHLAWGGAMPAQRDLPPDAVLVGRNMGPAELMEYPAGSLKAIRLEEGGPTAHATIVARAMGVPLIGRLEDLRDIVDEGDQVIVDAFKGEVHVRPDPGLLDAYNSIVRLRSVEQAEFARLKDTPCITKDGRPIALSLNAGLPLDLRALNETGASGVGLYRTEFHFLLAERIPRLSEEQKAYAEILDMAGEKPVVFRTLDIGSDKVVSFFSFDREENPALGWRAIRQALDRPVVLRRQLRALIGAAEGRRLDVMFPFVATIDELVRVRAMLDKELAWAKLQGRKGPADIHVGVMLEAPSLVFQIDQLKGKADFVSVGTNDLMQYFFAADRTNPRVADRYDILSPAALRFLKMVADSCRAAGLKVSVCGEAAGHTLEAMVLIALGFDALSMPASGVGPVKRMALGLDSAAAASGLAPLLNSTAASVREDVLKLSQSLGVIV